MIRTAVFGIARFVTLLILVSGVTAAPTLAQDARPGVFGEVIEVRIVNIEAVVTDKEGIRVRGLGPDAFRLSNSGNVAQKSRIC